MSVSLALLCAGNSTRFHKKVKKQWLRIKDKPLWLFVLDRFIKFYNFEKIILVGHQDEIKYMENFISNDKICIVAGGESRQESLKNAIKNINSEHIMVSDIARCCMDKKFILDILRAISQDTVSKTEEKSSGIPENHFDNLTNRELDVLDLMAKRYSNKEIAEALFISSGTVKRHAINIFQKLDVHKRREAVLKAQHLGILKT